MEFLNKASIKTSRRKFLVVSTALVSGAMVLRNLFVRETKKKGTAKFLTQEGTLVEIDLKNLPSKKRKVDNNELVSWIWKNQKL
jgi:hypothetical protein